MGDADRDMLESIIAGADEAELLRALARRWPMETRPLKSGKVKVVLRLPESATTTAQKRPRRTPAEPDDDPFGIYS